MLSREQETLDYLKEHKLEGLMTQLIELATYHQVQYLFVATTNSNHYELPSSPSSAN